MGHAFKAVVMLLVVISVVAVVGFMFMLPQRSRARMKPRCRERRRLFDFGSYALVAKGAAAAAAGERCQPLSVACDCSSGRGGRNSSSIGSTSSSSSSCCCCSFSCSCSCSYWCGINFVVVARENCIWLVFGWVCGVLRMCVCVFCLFTCCANCGLKCLCAGLGPESPPIANPSSIRIRIRIRIRTPFGRLFIKLFGQNRKRCWMPLAGCFLLPATLSHIRTHTHISKCWSSCKINIYFYFCSFCHSLFCCGARASV